jgi:hypothetical protein
MLGLGRLLKSSLSLRQRLANLQHKTPIEMQAKTLRKLIEQAENTAFGQQYEFEKLGKMSDAQLLANWKSLPIFDYDSMYNQWWHRSIAGESDVTWAGKIKTFALSSGTSGGPTKYIPVSKQMLKSMRRTSLHMLSSSAKMGLPTAFYSGPFLMVGSSTAMRPHPENPDVLIGDVSGINAAQIPAWFDLFYKPGKKIAALPTWEARLEAIVTEAPKWDIKLIAGIPSWVQLILEAIIARYQLNNISEIWPNLQVFSSGGVAFAPYRERFIELIGRPILFFDTYYTSEGALACQSRIDGDKMPMELMLRNGIFFEFVPFDDKNFDDGKPLPTAEVLNIGEVKENVSYAVLLSTCSGAWRYLLGDTVRFTSVERSEIVITGRTKHYLSICGEHLSVENMNTGLLDIAQKYGLQLPEFTVKALKIDNHFEHHWFVAYIGAPPAKAEEAEITAALDAALCSINDDYATERKDNLLRHIRLRFLPIHTFFDWQAKQGKAGGQVKFPRVLTEAQFKDWLAFVNT